MKRFQSITKGRKQLMGISPEYVPVRQVILIGLPVLLFHFLTQDTSVAQTNPDSHMRLSNTITLVVGKSQVLNLPVQVKRISLADPEIADTIVISPQQIYLRGKTVGSTNVTVWRADDTVYKVLDLEIIPNLTQIKKQLHSLLPDEPHIRVSATHDHITLAGNVSSSANVSKALTLAETFAPKKVLNLMQVAGVQQVMLEVRVAEMNRQLLRRLGVNFGAQSPNSPHNDFGISALNRLTIPNLSSALVPGLGQAINAILQFQSGEITWAVFIDALKQHDLVKILAEPTLVALSGQEASFLAGGEFPFPVPQSFAVTTIKFKKFGVGLNFTPTIVTQDKISIRVSPEVSQLDFTNAVQIQGFLIPSITTRRAATTIELSDGQSFAIAGLLQDTVRQQISKFPFLGDLPILGPLFRSSQFQKNETELIIIVTPHLAKPVDMARQTLPTDSYVEPNDMEYYILGYREGRLPQHNPSFRNSKASSPPPPRVKNRFEGHFGHLTPGT